MKKLQKRKVAVADTRKRLKNIVVVDTRQKKPRITVVAVIIKILAVI